MEIICVNRVPNSRFVAFTSCLTDVFPSLIALIKLTLSKQPDPSQHSAKGWSICGTKDKYIYLWITPSRSSQRLQEMTEMAVLGSRRIFLGAVVITLVTVRGCFESSWNFNDFFQTKPPILWFFGYFSNKKWPKMMNFQA